MSQAPMNPNYVPMPTSRSTGLAIASLVLGIISLFVCLTWVAAICGVLAIIFGAVARNKVRDGTGAGEGMAKAGLIMGCIGLALDVLFTILALTIGVSFMKGLQQFQQHQQQQQWQQLLPATAPATAPATPAPSNPAPPGPSQPQ